MTSNGRDGRSSYAKVYHTDPDCIYANWKLANRGTRKPGQRLKKTTVFLAMLAKLQECQFCQGYRDFGYPGPQRKPVYGRYGEIA